MVLFDGAPLTAYEGETVAAALLAAGVRKARVTASGDARGPYCGIGVCFDCAMEIDGLASVRACQTQVHEGMDVRTQTGFGAGPGAGDGD